LKKYFQDRSEYRSKVYVVDNGSSDDSVKTLRRVHEDSELLLSPKNLGFAGGNNLALKKVTSRYVMLLNSDTELSSSSKFDQLIEYMDTHEDVAVITPKVVLDTGELDMASHRGEPTPWAALTYFSGLAALRPNSRFYGQYHQLYKKFQTVHEIDACSGAAMLVRKEAMDKVGLLDERFFMYAEDLDWCHRFRDAGYKVVYFPNAPIVHHKYKSGMGNQDVAKAKKVRSYFYDTMLQYFDKHFRDQYPGFVRYLLAQYIEWKKGQL
jgi:GT2 family glycosyltransferase